MLKYRATIDIFNLVFILNIEIVFRGFDSARVEILNFYHQINAKYWHIFSRTIFS